MKKRVVLELDIQDDYLSIIHRRIADLVSYIEDDDTFGIVSVKLEEPPKLPSLRGLGV